MMLARNSVDIARKCIAGQARQASTTASTSRSVLRLATAARQTAQRFNLPPLPLPLRQCRNYATPPPQVVHSELPIEKYHAYSDATMDQMLESLEALLDDIADPNYEVEYSSGVLTLKLGEKGTYVINKQPPNKQIWLSSPFSGPKRYDYSESVDDWVYNRDNRTLSDLLDKELSTALGHEITLGISGVSHLEA
ncbi:Frataxin [Daedalea quercina L-15889]|uniref:ferroxidase n=1 Tax=Daedalea quercina L-15889 TaxID=1314783 RepID=A0A165UF58_9APHY|nr:Frataxin [Daedalea quercina L-15889]